MISHIFLSMLPFPSSHSHWTCLFLIPPFLQVVANLTSNSSWLWSTSEVLCFLIWKTPASQSSCIWPTFFFLSEMCLTCPFFQGNSASLLKPCLAMASSSEVIPSSKCGLCGPPCSSTSLVHIFIAGHSTCCIVCLFCLHLLTISITHTGLSLASLQTDNYTHHSYFHYHQQRRGLHILDTQVEFNYEIQMKSLCFLYKLLPRFIFFKHFFSFLLMD